MKFNVYVEPSFENSIWCRQQLRSITDEAAAKRCGLNIIKCPEFGKLDLSAIPPEDTGRRLLICVSSTVEAVDRLRDRVSSDDIHMILINYPTSDLSENQSNIIADYAAAVTKIIRYLASAGKDRIALYGINPNSFTDIDKMNMFNSCGFSLCPEYKGSSVYYNYASLQECYGRFLSDIGAYNAVICANDIVAVSLLNNLRASGVRVPEDMYVISFGDTILAKIFSPSITNVSGDLFEFGRQAIYLYTYLSKRESNISLSVRVSSILNARGSTDFFPENPAFRPAALAAPANPGRPTPRREEIRCYPGVNFYGDPCAAEILRVEDLLSCLNEFDFNILVSLLNAESVISIAERLYTSQQAIAYRIKRMCQITATENKTKLLALMRPYLTPSAIDAYRENARFPETNP